MLPHCGEAKYIIPVLNNMVTFFVFLCVKKGAVSITEENAVSQGQECKTRDRTTHLLWQMLDYALYHSLHCREKHFPLSFPNMPLMLLLHFCFQFWALFLKIKNIFHGVRGKLRTLHAEGGPRGQS